MGLGLVVTPPGYLITINSLVPVPGAECGLKPFYRGAKVTVIGAISLKKVVGLMALLMPGYEGLNMQVRETSIHKTSGFSSYFFHTLIKQRRINDAEGVDG